MAWQGKDSQRFCFVGEVKHIQVSSIIIPLHSNFCMRYFVLIAATFLSLTKAYAQSNHASLTFQADLPQGDYKDHYSKLGTGLLLGFTHILKSKPSIAIGSDVGLLQVSNAGNSYTGLYRNSNHNYYASATNYIITVAPKLKINLFTFKKSATVFTDLTIGTNIFYTYAAISHYHGHEFLSRRPRSITDSSFSHGSLALRCGLGLGTEIPLGKKNKLALLLKFSYLYGSKANYFSNPHVQGLQITLTPQQSKTSMFLAETGIRFSIFNKRNKG